MRKKEAYNYIIVGMIFLGLVSTLFFLKGGGNLTGYAILGPGETVERGSYWDRVDKGGGSYNLQIHNTYINRHNGSDYIPITFGSCGNNCFRDNDGLIYRTGGGGTYIELYDPDDNFISNFGFAITGSIGATNYKYSTLNFTWTWTVENTTDEYIFRGYNNRANFNWTQEFHFYSNQSMKIKNTITNNLGANIENTKFWFIQTVGETDGVWFNGTKYDQDISRSGEFDSLIADIRFEDNYFFKYDDILTNGFNITNFYLGSGSVIGVDSIRILAIGITKGNSVFPDGVTVIVDPTITISGNGKDAYVKGDAANTNKGSDPELLVKWGTPKRNSYLEFNISSIPDNQIIDNSTLCLYLWNDQGSQTIGAYHVTENWNESEITWNNQPCGTDFDNASACNLTAESTLSNDGSQDDTWQCWDILNMVDEEYNSNSEKISIVLHTEDSGSADKFHSKEYSNLSLWPYLNITYHTSDTIPPNVTINSPTNSTSTTNSITFNITTEEALSVDSCLYTLDSGLNNFTMSNSSTAMDDYTASNTSMSQGSHTATFYCNDSNNNLNNSESVTFFIDSISPTISLDSPQDGSTIGFNESINLNFSASDTNLDNCWYNINNGQNVTIASCQNTTFNVSGDGSYNLTIYANDSVNLVSNDLASFTVQVGAPTITLHSPINISLNNQAVEFNYTPSDTDLEACQLWGNFSGTFELNQTNLVPTNDAVNTFSLNLTDSNYLWNIKCNDTQGNSAVNGNKTFTIDTITPSLTITEPTGSKTSRTDIPLEFSVNDTNLGICLYNVYSGASLEVSNTTISCSQNSSFNVSSDSDFTLNFYVNDSAGNINDSSSSFTVSTGGGGGGGGGGGSSGGGGGGGGRSIPTNGKLEVSKIGNIISRQDDNKILSVNVRNVGGLFINDCRLTINGDISSWIYSDKIQGVAPGENVDFLIEINVPQETASGEYSGTLDITCKEDSNSQELTIRILEGLGSIEIIDIINEPPELKISYTFDNSDFIGDNIDIEIWIIDDEGIEIKRITDNFPINKEGLIERNIVIELPENSVGIYDVFFALASDLESYTKRSIILGKSVGTGQAILGTADGKGLPFLIFILVIGVGVFFIFRTHRKNVREMLKKKSPKKVLKNNSKKT